MTRIIASCPITKADFAEFGQIIDASDPPNKMINQGHCGRHNDLAELDFGNGRAGISVFNSLSFSLPYTVEMMERHPQGSQAFLPLHQGPYLIVVASDANGKPSAPKAFIAKDGQGINIGRNIWHGVLCPLADPGLFAVVDHISDGPNLEEHWFEEPWVIT